MVDGLEQGDPGRGGGLAQRERAGGLERHVGGVHRVGLARPCADQGYPDIDDGEQPAATPPAPRAARTLPSRDHAGDELPGVRPPPPTTRPHADNESRCRGGAAASTSCRRPRIAVPPHPPRRGGHGPCPSRANVLRSDTFTGAVRHRRRRRTGCATRSRSTARRRAPRPMHDSTQGLPLTRLGVALEAHRRVLGDESLGRGRPRAGRAVVGLGEWAAIATGSSASGMTHGSISSGVSLSDRVSPVSA